MSRKAAAAIGYALILIAAVTSVWYFDIAIFTDARTVVIFGVALLVGIVLYALLYRFNHRFKNRLAVVGVTAALGSVLPPLAAFFVFLVFDFIDYPENLLNPLYWIEPGSAYFLILMLIIGVPMLVFNLLISVLFTVGMDAMQPGQRYPQQFLRDQLRISD